MKGVSSIILSLHKAQSFEARYRGLPEKVWKTPSISVFNIIYKNRYAEARTAVSNVLVKHISVMKSKQVSVWRRTRYYKRRHQNPDFSFSSW